jgi:tetratricopeptide (TPR) repeat protein
LCALVHATESGERPYATPEQWASIEKLRKSVAALSVERDVCEKRLDTALRREELEGSKLAACLFSGEALLLKRELVGPEQRERLDVESCELLIGASDTVDSQYAICGKMFSLVEKIGFPEQKELRERLEASLDDYTGLIADFAGNTYDGEALSGERLEALLGALLGLAMLKGYSADFSTARGMLEDYYELSRSGEMKMPVILGILNFRPEGTPSDWAKNVRKSYAELKEEIERQMRGVEDAKKAVSEAREREEECVAAASERGIRLTPAKPGSAKESLALAWRRLSEDRKKLHALLGDAASRSPESKTARFSGLGDAQLKELARFWESFHDHPKAQGSLAQIYLQLKDYDKALKAIDSDLCERKDFPSGGIAPMDSSGANGTVDAIGSIASLQLKEQICREAGMADLLEKTRRELSAQKIVLWSAFMSTRKELSEAGNFAVSHSHSVSQAEQAWPEEEAECGEGEVSAEIPPPDQLRAPAEPGPGLSRAAPAKGARARKAGKRARRKNR